MQQPPSKPRPDDDSVSHADLTQSPEEVLEYWTQERMREAKPREIRLPEPDPRPDEQD